MTRQFLEALAWLQRLGEDTDEFWIARALERYGIEPTEDNIDNLRMLATAQRY
ncbi:hypothetical protein GFS31_41750 (plasmid) [Leptolyngbya sp. BL0902]|uniref:hypothetical protein n=1 Tax=Leptolyngbya sp. BL0902 TaxID=1115757 RepID=UPI0018E8EC76|nr:hypothetical protein [Leptolyngbya sp. BL0902]QQE67462.1 hypothetical protein GFS31_41750 [Leptolyngbya sp. BL0902]